MRPIPVPSRKKRQRLSRLPSLSRAVFIFAVPIFVFVTVGIVKPQEKIVVAYSGVSGFQGPLWAFSELKLFSKYGLSPEVVLISGGTLSMQALLSGQTHFALTSAMPPINARLQGGDVVILGAALNTFPYSMVAQKEIDHPSKLVGKKFGLVNFGGAGELAIILALKKWGIPRQAVTLLRRGGDGGTGLLLALSSKAIDAVLLSPPFATEAKRRGFNILAHLGEIQAFFPMTVVVVNRSFLEKKRGIVKQFIKGYSEAIYRLMQSKDTGIKIYRKYLGQQDLKVLEDTYDDIAGKFSFPPRVNRDGMRNALDMVLKGGVSAKVDAGIEQFIDETISDELEREGFFNSIRKS